MTATAAPKLSKAELAAFFIKAAAAGAAAAEAHTPTPMYVVERANSLDDTSPVVKAWAPVMGGVCGFAWVKIMPGTSSAARYAAKYLGARKGYYGGMELWVKGYGQSMEKKMAYATAFASVLTSAGFTAYSNSKMD